MTRVLVIAIVTGAGIFGWCSRRLDTTLRAVVLITLDTTRADRLPPYGLMDVATPGLDRLAREGVLFQQALSVAPLTLPAHTSLLTGILPPGHGVRDNADELLASTFTPRAEVLHDRGFRTGAFVGSIVLNADRGLAQGFDRYSGVVDDGQPAAHRWQRRGDAVMADAIAWLDAIGDERFFMWTHLYDPHRPYEPPEPFRSRHSDPYIGEIAFADSQIARLLDVLERRQLLDRTLIVVTADHGESLGDHGERDHGIFVYESVLRVPLIIRAPGGRPGRVDRVVRLIDVMPTVLDVLGLELPRMDGVSLRAALEGSQPPPDLDAYAESLYPRKFGWSPVRALRDGRFKLIDAPRPELYDLERDPFEEHNVYEQRPAIANGMSRRLNELAGPRVDPGPEAVASGELRERLAALGYVGSGASTRAQDFRDLPDAKDCIHQLSPLVDDVNGSGVLHGTNARGTAPAHSERSHRRSERTRSVCR